jgi:hypothetical protein
MNMKWYLARLLFAQKPRRGKSLAFCETCLVLLRAANARSAYDKATEWAKRELQHEGLTEMGLLGVTTLEELLATQLRDGTEITGSVFFKKDPWKHRKKLVPPIKRLQAFLFENNANVPCGKVITEVRGKSFVSHMKRLNKK